MNYKKIYETFIFKCQNTTIRERLYNRNCEDFRLNHDYIYTEKHHILPVKCGGDNSKNNLVELLPEEHLFAHLIRYKAFNDRVDFIAIRYMLNSFNNNDFKNGYINGVIDKNIKRTYIFMKQNSAEFRKIHGWQTEDGVRRISQARKGTFPMKDVVSGEIVGSFSKEHPKYLSGEWVHHSTGKVPVLDKLTGENLYIDSEIYQNNKERYDRRGSDNSGKNNSRYIDVCTFSVFHEYEKFCIENGFICKYGIFHKLYLENLITTEIQIIVMTKFRIKQLGGLPNIVLMNKHPNLLYMVKNGYNSTDKSKVLNGFKNPEEYLFDKYRNIQKELN